MFLKNPLKVSTSRSTSPANTPTPTTFGKRAPEVAPLATEVTVSRSQVGSPKNRLAKDKSSAGNSLESTCSTNSQIEYAAPHQTMIIFDWDDTLCPSHYIRINRPQLHYFQPCPNDPKHKVPLGQLAETGIKALREASKIGRVIIITNAQPQWVEISCRNFLPGVWAVIKELNIDIVYARVGFETGDPNSEYNYNMNAPQLWKEKAMREHVSKFYSQYVRQSWKNIISIGDQICEHNACRIVSENRPYAHKECRIKTVKLLEEPSIEDLVSELQVVTQWLTGLVKHDGSLDLDLNSEESVIYDIHKLLSEKE